MNLRLAAVVLVLLPHFDIIINACILFLEFLTLTLFIVISFKDPSYERVKTSIPELYATIKPDFICPYCSVKKLHTTVHCHHCRKCVRKFDHHCPWINNCVGEGNHRTFVVYLMFLCLDLLSTIALGVMRYCGIHEAQNSYMHVYFVAPDFSPLIISAICIPPLLLILPLLWIQISNLLSKKTTHDKYSYKKNGVFSSLSSTSSILLKDSEDWSYFSKKSEKLELDDDRGCCRRRTLPHLNQSSTINEENE